MPCHFVIVTILLKSCLYIEKITHTHTYSEHTPRYITLSICTFTTITSISVNVDNLHLTVKLI